MAKDSEGTGGVAEEAGHFLGRLTLDKVGAEGLVLAMQGQLWGKEEGRFGRCR